MLSYLKAKLVSFLLFLKNAWYYRSTLSSDYDHHYKSIYILLLAKLKKVEKYWGRHTSYIGDFDDKIKLQKLIVEIEEFIESEDSKSEKENIKESTKLLSRVGRLIPRLWD